MRYLLQRRSGWARLLAGNCRLGLSRSGHHISRHCFSIAIYINSIAPVAVAPRQTFAIKILIFGTPRNCNPPKTAQRLPSTFWLSSPKRSQLVVVVVGGRGAEMGRERERGAWAVRGGCALCLAPESLKQRSRPGLYFMRRGAMTNNEFISAPNAG